MNTCPFDETKTCGKPAETPCSSTDCPTWLEVLGIQTLQKEVLHRDNCRYRLREAIREHCRSCGSTSEISGPHYIDAACPVCGDEGLEKVREEVENGNL